jgi:hypothetical protein
MVAKSEKQRNPFRNEIPTTHPLLEKIVGVINGRLKHFNIRYHLNYDRPSLPTSVSDPDPHSIGRLDPDPGILKRAKMKKKTQLKDR